MEMGMEDSISSHQNQLMLQAHVELWHQSLSYLKSLALAVAMDLRIPDAIHRQGGAATVPQILAGAALHPCKLRPLRRLMRALAVAGTVSVVHQVQPPAAANADAVIYRLTAASRFLVTDSDDAVTGSPGLSPFVTLQVHAMLVTTHARGLCAWFRQEQPSGPSPFALASGETQSTFWELPGLANTVMNRGLAAESRFLMPVVLEECREVFDGLDSLVDVGGGLGGAATAIAAAIPRIQCSVLDLPHVVAGAPADSGVQFVAGDMFQSIPSANAVFLKTTLHDWGDEECLKILSKCKQAISPWKGKGGKVIIIDMVVGQGTTREDDDAKRILETQVMFDLFIMLVNGVERNEQEWKEIFVEAGFKDYKIIPALGVYSIIEERPGCSFCLASALS